MTKTGHFEDKKCSGSNEIHADIFKSRGLGKSLKEIQGEKGTSAFSTPASVCPVKIRWMYIIISCLKGWKSIDDKASTDLRSLQIFAC